MADQNPLAMNRRKALKSLGALGTAGIGLSLGAGSAAAAPDGPRIEVESESSGTYLILIDHPNVEAGDDATADNIQKNSDDAYLQGDIEEGETHTFYTEYGNITYANLRDSVLVDVWDPLGMNREGDLTVEGVNTNYLVGVTEDIDPNGETGEIIDNNATGEGEDLDHQYIGDGTIFALHAVPLSSTSWARFEHDI